MTKKILIYRKQSEIDGTITGFARFRDHFQEVITQFNDLHIGTIEDRNELLEAIRQPNEFIRMKLEKRIAAEPVVISGIPLRISKVIELLDTGEVSQFVNVCKANQYHSHFFERIGNIDANGKVFQDNELLEKFTNMPGISIFATSEKEIAILEALQLMISTTEELKAAGAKFHFESVRLSDIMIFNQSKGHYELRPEFFQKVSG